MTKKKQFQDLSISAKYTRLDSLPLSPQSIENIAKLYGFKSDYPLEKSLKSAYENFLFLKDMPKQPSSLNSKSRLVEFANGLSTSANQFDALHQTEVAGILSELKYLLEPNDLLKLSNTLNIIATATNKASEKILQPPSNSQKQLDRAQNEFIDNLLVIYEDGTGKRATRGWKNSSNRDSSKKGITESAVIKFCLYISNALNLNIKATRIDSYLRDNQPNL